ncbi:MAG: patatin-like phospholipase family protein [Actinophytocola sp.]|uniref:patatin-like phospholipase family protein n=1 Tax=Actinophytocola sp. TaxID=1872138 RepID=UPI003C750CC9
MSTPASSPDGRNGWAADSPAIGAGLQPRPCGDQLRPAKPATEGKSCAVTVSGGGFRATLAGLGALRLLADIRMLSRLRYLSSVSGGSITNAATALAWPALRRREFTSAAYDELVVDPVVHRISRRSLKVALILGIWRTAGPATRTDLLARHFDKWFFDGAVLENLDPEVRWIISAANLVTGARFSFERDVVGDYTTGLTPTAGTGLRLSLAVAASSAVPGAFAPVVLDGLRLPCATEAPVLLDGGIYDNTGLEALSGDRYRQTFLVTMNAGGLLRPGPYGRIPLVRELVRANALLYRQSTTLRTRHMVSQFERGRAVPPSDPVPPDGRRGVLVGLATDVPRAGTGMLAVWRAAHPEHRTFDGVDLSLVPTAFDKMDPALCRALIYRGWWLVGAALALYHPEYLPDPATVTAPPLG